MSYNATSSDTIGIDLFTPAPPGAVDPATGNYNASDHPFLINQGTLTGSATIFGSTSGINVDFAATPFGSANTGTGGNIALSFLSTPASATYEIDLPTGGSAGDLTILYTPDLSQDFVPLSSGAVSVGNPIPAGYSGSSPVQADILPGALMHRRTC